MKKESSIKDINPCLSKFGKQVSKMYLSLNPTGIGDCSPVMRAHEKTLTQYLKSGIAEQNSLI